MRLRSGIARIETRTCVGVVQFRLPGFATYHRPVAKIVIIGAAETSRLGIIDDVSPVQLHAEAVRNAINDAGIGRDDIDGVACVGEGPAGLANYLGITPTWLDGTFVGGCSFLAHLHHASAAISAGMAKVIVVSHAVSRGGPPSSPGFLDLANLQQQFEQVYGVGPPATKFPLGVLRYMRDFGLTHQQLASVAVAQRRWSSQVPRAMMRDLITVEDVFASPMICYPMHRLECCLTTNGGGAIIVTSEEHAASLPVRQPPVYVLGGAESSESPLASQMADLTTSRAYRTTGRIAFEQAGITVADVDHLMAYDAFAHLPIYTLEDLGFVGRGEAGAFIEDGHTSPGGSLPMNTNGGGLSYTHTGMYGMFLMQESIRQVRGEAAAQVDDVKISVAHGVGSMFTSASTIVFGSAEAAEALA
jgi:acetyl-CoA acetyltransferase